MRRKLIHSERDLLRAGAAPDDVGVSLPIIPLMQRNASAKVRQCESRHAIAAVCGSNQGEQDVVSSDGQKLTVAEHPACWGEVTPKDPNLANVWLCHEASSSAKGKFPGARYKTRSSDTVAYSDGADCLRYSTPSADSMSWAAPERRTHC